MSESIKELAAQSIVEIISGLSSVKRVRRVLATYDEAVGFASTELPAVAVVERSFESECVRAGHYSEIQEKTTRIDFLVTIYIHGDRTPETRLNAILLDIIAALEGDQDLGGVAHHLDCVSGERDSLSPLHMQSLTVRVVYHHNARTI